MDLTKGNVEFTATGIRFASYPYPPARCVATGGVEWRQAKSIDSTALPPELRIDGEILFVPAESRDALIEASSRHGVADIRYVDIWSLLLEPFLDTAFTDDNEQRTQSVLLANGVREGEVTRVRSEVGECMRRYNQNSGLWDWRHLGLMDVLDAHRGRLSGRACRLSDEAFERFYWAAMELALRGKPVG